jgi:predicted CXXCH cytochrome family protein
MTMIGVCSILIASAAIAPAPTATYVGAWKTNLNYPARIASAPGGGIYVTDPPSNQVIHYDSLGVWQHTYPIPEGPVGIAVHGDGRVFVSRNDGKIGVYPAGFVGSPSFVNPAPFVLRGPNDLAFHPGASELYAVDAGGHLVLVFREIGGTWTLNRAWGLEGSEASEFESPQAIALDTTLNLVFVTDVDNFRVQVFNTLGISQGQFGYRIIYTPSTETAWFARSEGLAVDAHSNIFITDALMGTVRVFAFNGSAWNEMDPDNDPVIGYGTTPGKLRVPCDVMITGSKLYVADTNNAAVEVYDVTYPAASAAAAAGPPRETAGRTAKEGRVRIADRSDGSYPVRAGVPRMPDNPAEIVAVINAGGFREDLDLNRDRVINVDDLEIAVTRFGAGTVDDFLNDTQAASQVASHDPIVPPHILDIANRCGRCHSMDGAPGGMLTALGQENLCQSCHSAGKIAGSAPIGAGSLEKSHPWGVPTDDMNLDPQSPLALHLDNGNVRCGTCHDPHENRPVGTCVTGVCEGGPFDGSVCKNNSECAAQVKFLREEIYHGEDHFPSQGGTPEVHARKRMTALDPAPLCGQCHADIVAQWSIVGHAERDADPWSHYDWSMGNNWLCTGPGTPYAYCTGDGAGTATSPALALCTGPATPLACCTGAGTGTCTISNASCTGAQTPWQCCLGSATGNCIANSACTGFQTPSPCCTGVGTGTCSNGLPAAMCTGAGAPEPCCSAAGAGSCSDRADCRQCHSGNGYIDYSKDFPDGAVKTSTHRGSLRVIDCLVCHATHGTSQDGKLLRIYNTVRLPTGQVFTGVGGGATCMACHNGRTVPPTNPSSVSTPHYLNGGAMLEGINAVTTFPNGPGAITYALSNSNHTTNGGLNCTTCHMAPGPTSGPEVGKVGDHTYRLKDHDTGYENVAACNTAACHGGVPLTTINRTANGDYDGNGSIQGIQTEARGLLILLKDALNAAGALRLLLDPVTGLATADPNGGLSPDGVPTYPYWTLRQCSGGTRNGLACNGAAPTFPFDCPGGTCPQIPPTGNRTSTLINAIWNWEFVENSHDLGVKNTGYAIGLLQIAYKGVTGTPLPRLDLCTAPATPWACCTGAGTGSCSAITAYRYTPVP